MVRSCVPFFRCFTTSFGLRAVECSVSYHLSPGPALLVLNPYQIIFAVTAFLADNQLEVACLLSCVLLDEHLT